jgi:hypothetical protein
MQKYASNEFKEETHMRDYNLKSYGLDILSNETLDEQKGCCKICNRHCQEVNKGRKSLYADHCQ